MPTPNGAARFGRFSSWLTWVIRRGTNPSCRSWSRITTGSWMPDRLKRIPQINGKYRRCALQEASVVFIAIKLDLMDDRIHQLVHLLLKWQWPDGGWNCDKNPTASHSSFYETWLPLRALHAYAQRFCDDRAQRAAEHAAEIFLSRKLYKRKEDGTVMEKGFTQLAFPPYWHYDILAGLRVMGEIGKLKRPPLQGRAGFVSLQTTTGWRFCRRSKILPGNRPRGIRCLTGQMGTGRNQ